MTPEEKTESRQSTPGKISNLQKVGGFLVLQIPASAALFKFWPEVKTRPALSFAIICCYEFIIGLLAFLKSVWKEELESDAKKALANQIRAVVSRALAAFSNISPGFQRNYHSELLREYGLFNDRGLGLISANRLDLRSVFVTLRIAVPGKAGDLDTGFTTSNRSGSEIWEFIRNSRKRAESSRSVFAILGAPGSGKTTLLHHLVLTMASNTQHNHHVEFLLPVLLFIREHGNRISSEPTITLQAIILSQLQRQFPSLRVPSGWIHSALRKGKCLIMFDGLDEVADSSVRRNISSWLHLQVRTYPRALFFLTSRPLGYKSAPIPDAQVLEVQSFESSQVTKFIHNWSVANEVVSSGGKRTRDVIHHAKRLARDLLDRLEKAPAVTALTANPLLLTMVCMVHRYHGALPGSRVQLYSEICQVLLERWRQARGVSESIRGDQKLAALKPLASFLMHQSRRQFNNDEALSIMSTQLERIGVPVSERLSFLQDIQSSGLLLERENGLWEFAHLTFQEYLTSLCWQDVKPTWQFLVSAIEESWWQEVIRLFAAQTDASELVALCLDRATPTTMALALDCAEMARELSPATRKRIESDIRQVVDDPDDPRNRLVSQVLVSRRLSKAFIRVNSNSEIDNDFVSAAEYQLVLDANRSSLYARGNGSRPILGVTPQAAQAYCDWLNQQSSPIVHYRLPLETEVNAAGWPEDGPPAWALTERGFRLCGWSPQRLREVTEQVLPHVTSTELATAIIQEGFDFQEAALIGGDYDRARFVLRKLGMAKLDANRYARGMSHLLRIALSCSFTDNADIVGANYDWRGVRYSVHEMLMKVGLCDPPESLLHDRPELITLLSLTVSLLREAVVNSRLDLATLAGESAG